MSRAPWFSALRKRWWFSLDSLSWAGLIVVPLIGVVLLVWKWIA